MSLNNSFKALFFQRLLLLCSVFFLASCSDIDDDLNPSGSDKRVDGVAGEIGPHLGQKIADFSLTTTEGNIYTRDELLAAGQPLVFYFTLWCPICDTHMSHYRNQLAPDFPGVNYLPVDFVSGGISASRDSQISAGYRNVTTLVDDRTLEKAVEGSMGTTVVVGLDGLIHLNEDYKTGDRLRQVLETLTQ